MKSFTEHHHCLFSDFCICFYFPAGPYDPAWGWKLPFSFPQRKSSGQHCWIHDGKVKNNTREQSMAWPKHHPSTILTIKSIILKSNASNIKTSDDPEFEACIWRTHRQRFDYWTVFYILSWHIISLDIIDFFCTLEQYEWAQVFFYSIK